MTTKAKVITISSLVAILVLAGFIFFRFFFVFGEGVKAGELNFVVYKGYVFKTYEGRLIQAGFKSGSKSTATIESNEFNFSITDPKIAEELMRRSGETVQLHYKEYLGTLPWRGKQKYVVDRIEKQEEI
ncbi:MAG: hypothetical protein MJZ16_10700 [Bacteroidales bacterium]|nr:hypothetical protein [Bacteroidales bacterium]